MRENWIDLKPPASITIRQFRKFKFGFVDYQMEWQVANLTYYQANVKLISYKVRTNFHFASLILNYGDHVSAKIHKAFRLKHVLISTYEIM